MVPFSDIEIRLIEKEVSKKSFQDISFLIDRPVDEIAAFVKEYFVCSDVVFFQDKLIDKAKSKMERFPKMHKLKERKPREPKPKPAKIISREIRQETKSPRAHTRLPKFETMKVDYSKMKSIRIDHKTIIYVKPGQDPEVVKANYLKNCKSYSARQNLLNP